MICLMPLLTIWTSLNQQTFDGPRAYNSERRIYFVGVSGNLQSRSELLSCDIFPDRHAVL